MCESGQEMRCKSVGAQLQKKERATERNHNYFKVEMTEQDTKCDSELSFLKDVAAVVTSVFPRGK